VRRDGAIASYIRPNFAISALPGDMRFFLGIVSTCLLAVPDLGLACSCVGGPSLEQSFEQASTVFIGKLKKVELVETLAPVDGSSYRRDRAVGEFVTVETFKGYPSLVEVTADGSFKTSCSVNLVVGYHYLIFADDNGKAHIGSCSRSRPIDYIDENKNLRELRRITGKDAPAEEPSY